jgi:hypothetical protein
MLKTLQIQFKSLLNTGSLGEKFGINADAASGVAGSLIPKILGS